MIFNSLRNQLGLFQHFIAVEEAAVNPHAILLTLFNQGMPLPLPLHSPAQKLLYLSDPVILPFQPSELRTKGIQYFIPIFYKH